MSEILKALRCYVTYSYSEGNLIISYRKRPMFKISQPDRKNAFAYAKEHEYGILVTISNRLEAKPGF